MMNNVEPRVSVIVITYNQERSIAAALSSVLAQKCPFPFEVVIGDDGSTDGTRAVCERFARKYPDIVRLMPKAPNKGLVLNYFDCLRACRGEYVADCAGDDTWASPERLAWQAEYLDAHPECSVVLSDWNIIEDGKNVNSAHLPLYSKWRHALNGNEVLVQALGAKADFPFLSAMLFRRRPIADILKRNPSALCRPEWGCEDVPVLAALASAGSMGFLPLPAANYTIDSGSVSHKTSPEKMFDYYLRAATCVMDLCEIHSVAHDSVGDAISLRLNYLASLALLSGDSVRYDRLKTLSRRCQWSKTVKSRLYLSVMELPPLWKFVKWIRLRYASKI